MCSRERSLKAELEPLKPRVPEPHRPRSTLVTVIAWLGILSGIGTVSSGALMLAAVPGLRGFGWLTGGVLALITALGLRRRREWARRSYIGVQLFNCANFFVHMRGTPTAVRGGLLVMAIGYTAINGIIIAYLCSRKVREEFEAAI
jgi:uncharacterized membrane protein HdeD (DUF308 family)